MFGNEIFTEAEESDNTLSVYVTPSWWNTVYLTANTLKQSIETLQKTMLNSRDSSDYLTHRNRMINDRLDKFETEIHRLWSWAKGGTELQRAYFDATEYWIVVQTLQNLAREFDKFNATYPKFHDYLGSKTSDPLFPPYLVYWDNMMKHSQIIVETIAEWHDYIVLPVNGQILAHRSQCMSPHI